MKKVCFGWAIAAMLAATGCGGSASGGSIDPQFEGPVRSTNVEGGQVAFDRFCGSCHPGGGAGMGPNLKDMNAAPGKVRHVVRNGDGRMPPIPASELSDSDLEDVLAYMVSLRGIASDAPAVEAPTAE